MVRETPMKIGSNEDKGGGDWNMGKDEVRGWY